MRLRAHLQMDNHPHSGRERDQHIQTRLRLREGGGRVNTKELQLAALVQGAPCTQTDAELWFPERANSPEARLPKALCRSCPIRVECLATALADPSITDGIWGGLTASERDDIRGRQRRELLPHGTEGAIKRHRRAEQPLCEACQAARDASNERRQAKRRLDPASQRDNERRRARRERVA
jgi:WhiB family transcriptional regulator, redox-sensing transcriptional regulator